MTLTSEFFYRTDSYKKCFRNVLILHSHCHMILATMVRDNQLTTDLFLRSYDVKRKKRPFLFYLSKLCSFFKLCNDWFLLKKCYRYLYLYPLILSVLLLGYESYTIKKPFLRIYDACKGQTISKENYGFLNFYKKRTKLTILRKEDAQNM